MTMQIEGSAALAAALEVVGRRIEVAAIAAVAHAAHGLEATMKRNASTGSHRKGQPHIPGTGPGPNVVTGTLRRSIHVEGPVVHDHVVEASVGPSVHYAGPVEAGYPFVGPAVDALAASFIGTLDAAISVELSHLGAPPG